MTVPKAVVFDIGKVLLDFDYGIAARNIAARSPMSVADVQKIIDQSPLLLRYEQGLMTRDEFFAAVKSATGFQGELAEFAGAFGGIFTPIEPIVELHAAVRAAGFPTYVLSNTNDLAMEHIRASFVFFSQFDGYIFSYEQRAMKPHPRIYEVVEQVSGRWGAELIYLDDRPEHVAAAKARGWQVVLHENPEISRAALRKAGLPV
jgi:FMN phosphatase YigB (HAD superfamily)